MISLIFDRYTVRLPLVPLVALPWVIAYGLGLGPLVLFLCLLLAYSKLERT